MWLYAVSSGSYGTQISHVRSGIMICCGPDLAVRFVTTRSSYGAAPPPSPSLFVKSRSPCLQILDSQLCFPAHSSDVPGTLTSGHPASPVWRTCAMEFLGFQRDPRAAAVRNAITVSIHTQLDTSSAKGCLQEGPD